jgi:hypothetical protein
VIGRLPLQKAEKITQLKAGPNPRRPCSLLSSKRELGNAKYNPTLVLTDRLEEVHQHVVSNVLTQKGTLEH